MATEKQKKVFAPIILFMVLFAGLVVFVYFLTKRQGKSQEKVYKTLELDKLDKDFSLEYWQQMKEPALMVERNNKMLQILSNGTRIFYSVEPELQSWLKEEFKKYEVPYGAGVLMDIPAGKIIVMEGHSEFNSDLTRDELVFKAWAPGASLFKIIAASALLDTESFDPELETCYHGGKRGLRPHHFKDDPEKDDKCEDLYTAFANSTNAVFAKLAHKHLSPRQLLSYAHKFGFNSYLDFNFPLEKSMIQINKNDPLAVGYTAAGFGNVTLSPVHAAVIAGIIANQGNFLNPWLVEKVVSAEGNILFKHQPRKKFKRILQPSVVEKLKKMMQATVERGTAVKAFYTPKKQRRLPFNVGGKTGTLSRKTPKYLQYTWFVGFAPVSRPKVAIAMLVVNPARWRTKAIYMAQRLLLQYFKLYPQDKTTKNKTR
ncbi:MAG: penicillin-binding transpeptidase domain-containing protein [Myxococcota bacterium]